jgi:hypothetical protein
MLHRIDSNGCTKECIIDPRVCWHHGLVSREAISSGDNCAYKQIIISYDSAEFMWLRIFDRSSTFFMQPFVQHVADIYSATVPSVSSHSLTEISPMR